MKLDLERVLVNFEGVALKERLDGDKSRDLTLGNAIVNALLVPSQDKSIRPESKVTRYKLAHRIFDAKGELNLTVDEAVLIKEVCLAFYAPIVAGQIAEIIDGEEDAAKKEPVKDKK